MSESSATTNTEPSSDNSRAQRTIWVSVSEWQFTIHIYPNLPQLVWEEADEAYFIIHCAYSTTALWVSRISHLWLRAWCQTAVSCQQTSTLHPNTKLQSLMEIVYYTRSRIWSQLVVERQFDALYSIRVSSQANHYKKVFIFSMWC